MLLTSHIPFTVTVLIEIQFVYFIWGAIKMIATSLLMAAFAVVTQPSDTNLKDFLPLINGTRWTYSEAHSTEIRTLTVTGRVRDKRTKRIVKQTILRNGARRRYVHWSAEAGRIVWHFDQTMGRRKNARDFYASRPVLTAPLETGRTWTWTEEPRSYQTSLSGTQLPDVYREGTSHMSARIIAINEEIKVPAGTFKTVHVRIFKRNTHGSYIKFWDYWFAKGIGIVQEKWVDAHYQLLSFQSESRRTKKSAQGMELHVVRTKHGRINYALLQKAKHTKTHEEIMKAVTIRNDRALQEALAMLAPHEQLFVQFHVREAGMTFPVQLKASINKFLTGLEWSMSFKLMKKRGSGN